MRPGRMRRGFSDLEISSDTQGILFANIALRLGEETTVDGIRSILRQTIEYLTSAMPALRPLVCEIELSADGTPRIAWKTPETSGAPSPRELSTWFKRANSNGEEFERLEDRARWGLLLPQEEDEACGSFTGLFVYGTEPDDDTRAMLNIVGRLTSHAFRKISNLIAKESASRRQTEIQNETLAWMENGADILWDATPDGLIRCRRVLNGHTDLGRNIDARNLRQFVIGSGKQNLYDILVKGETIRHQPVWLLDEGTKFAETSIQLIASVTPQIKGLQSQPYFVGTFTSVSRLGLLQAIDPATGDTLSLRQKREREERQRMEDDTMLEGLRLLLDNRSPRENLKRLVQLICGKLGGTQPILVESGFDGRPRVILPEHKLLNYAAGAVLDDLEKSVAEGRLALFDDGTRECQRICDAFGIAPGTTVAFSLPLRGQTAYLICTTETKDRLRSAAIAFVERFAFILRQALILRDEQALLAQTAKMAALGQMSASIAHELKQPLNTISLATQNLEALLMLPDADPSAVEAKLTRVMSQVERASNVIDRMRRFGRKSLEDQSTIVIHDLIEGVLLLMGHVLDRRSVEVELDLTPGLTVTGDELQLEQVLTNVIQNAVDAMSGIGTQSDQSDEHQSARPGKIRFRSYVSPDDPKINILRVEDNGPGFSAAAMEHAADAFFTTKPAEHGTGLGLAICESIIRDSGGRFTYGNHAEGGYVSFAMPTAMRPDQESP